MAGVTENYSKYEVREMIRFLQVEGASHSEIHRRLVSDYGQKSFSRKEVSVWCNKFRGGRTTLNDDSEKHRGILMTSHTDENSVFVEGWIKKDRRVKVPEIAEVNGIAESIVHEIISDLNLRRVHNRWVPKMPSKEHKTEGWLLELKIFAVIKTKESMKHEF
jgi:hypothetical protein